MDLRAGGDHAGNLHDHPPRDGRLAAEHGPFPGANHELNVVFDQVARRDVCGEAQSSQLGHHWYLGVILRFTGKPGCGAQQPACLAEGFGDARVAGLAGGNGPAGEQGG